MPLRRGCPHGCAPLGPTPAHELCTRYTPLPPHHASLLHYHNQLGAHRHQSAHIPRSETSPKIRLSASAITKSEHNSIQVKQHPQTPKSCSELRHPIGDLRTATDCRKPLDRSCTHPVARRHRSDPPASAPPAAKPHRAAIRAHTAAIRAYLA